MPSSAPTRTGHLRGSLEGLVLFAAVLFYFLMVGFVYLLFLLGVPG